jgi:hypothetical protein
VFRFGILTEAGDFHAYRIRHLLRERGHDCHLIESNRLSEHGRLSWRDADEDGPGVLADDDGTLVSPSELDVVWCRRVHAPAIVPEHVRDEEARAVIDRNVGAALDGLMLSEFAGRWVSDPRATRNAELKLVQLRTAGSVGLRIPQTLVSQDPERVRAFCEERAYEVVVKALAGSRTAPTMTGRVTPGILTEDAVRLCPAIYQELVPGGRHLRVSCFGEDVHTAVLTSERLDWRYPHDFDAEPAELDPSTRQRLLSVLSALDLRMGIFDLKLTDDDEPVWLELNPQGQFLFLEGLAEMPLSHAFADFLVTEAESAAHASTRVGSSSADG